MAYVNHNRILTIASGPINTAVSNVVIFSPTEPTARDNGGDLINGDRWINTELLTESIWYYGKWLLIGTLDLGGDIDGGNSGPHPDNPFILDGGSSLPHPEGTLTVDGGNSGSANTIETTVAKLDDIGDVTITDVQIGDIIQWNGLQWVNNPIEIPDEEIDEQIESKRQVQARVDVSTAYSGIWVGNTAPKADPNGRLGWHYSTVSDDKIGWEIFTQDLNAETPVTYEDLRAASLLIRAAAGSYYPYFSVYTRRKNDGNDANAQYRSRINFSNVTATAPATGAQLFTTGDAEYSSYQNIEHVRLTIDTANSVGPMEADEVVKNITVSTSSGKPDGYYNFVSNEFIVDTKIEMYQIELRATPSVTNMGRMLYQDTQPTAIGRINGDFWYDSVNGTLHIWTGTWTAL